MEVAFSPASVVADRYGRDKVEANTDARAAQRASVAPAGARSSELRLPRLTAPNRRQLLTAARCGPPPLRGR